MKSLITAICIAALPNLGVAESLKTIFVDVTEETTIAGYLWVKRPVIIFANTEIVAPRRRRIGRARCGGAGRYKSRQQNRPAQKISAARIRGVADGQRRTNQITQTISLGCQRIKPQHR